MFDSRSKTTNMNHISRAKPSILSSFSLKTHFLISQFGWEKSTLTSIGEKKGEINKCHVFEMSYFPLMSWKGPQKGFQNIFFSECAPFILRTGQSGQTWTRGGRKIENCFGRYHAFYYFPLAVHGTSLKASLWPGPFTWSDQDKLLPARTSCLLPIFLKKKSGSSDPR